MAKRPNEIEMFRNETCEGVRTDRVELQVLRSLAEICAIEEDWRSLERRCTAPFTFFQTYDWCVGWATTLGKEIQFDPAVYTVWQDGHLVLVWPMMARRGTLGVATLTTIGAPHSQYGNLLADQTSDTRDLIGRCWANILADKRFPRVQLNNVPDGSVLSRFLEGVAERSTIQNETSLLEFNEFADWDAYQSSLSSSTRRGRAKRRNKLARAGDVSFVALRPGDPDFNRAVDDVVAFKRQWILETGRVGQGLAWNNIEQCLQRFPGNRHGAEGLLIHALRLNGDNIAIELGFIKNGHYYCFLGGFDWAHRDLSPGKVQIESSMRWFLENGIQTYDFLPNPAEYKLGWTNNAVRVSDYNHATTTGGRIVNGLAGSHAREQVKALFYALPKPVRSLIHSMTQMRSQ